MSCCCLSHSFFFFFFFFNDTATTEIYTLSLHDALPICVASPERRVRAACSSPHLRAKPHRSEEHTSELQSRRDIVCHLLLEKKKKNKITYKLLKKKKIKKNNNNKKSIN